MAEQKDIVSHPPHYTSHPSGIECIHIAEQHNFNIGNAIKYLWRQGLKDSSPAIIDLQKAKQYIDFEIRRLERIADEEKHRKNQVASVDKKLTTVKTGNGHLLGYTVCMRPTTWMLRVDEKAWVVCAKHCNQFSDSFREQHANGTIQFHGAYDLEELGVRDVHLCGTGVAREYRKIEDKP